MKKTLAATLLAITVAAQMGVALADDKGPWTSDHPATWGLVSMPFRLVTGAVGVGLGTVTGGVQGIMDTEQRFAENTYAKAGENPLLVPVGLVGTAVAIPVGFLTGAPKGAVDMGREGYMWWDRF